MTLEHNNTTLGYNDVTIDLTHECQVKGLAITLNDRNVVLKELRHLVLAKCFNPFNQLSTLLAAVILIFINSELTAEPDYQPY